METNKREVVLVPYQPDWPAQFQREVELLYPVFRKCWIAVYHIGSTSIPGMSAKPILDIMPIVEDVQKVDTLQEPLADLGYIAEGEYGIEGRRYFHKGELVHFVHIHAFPPTSSHVERHILFRDYLRSHVQDAKAYETLKLGLVKQYQYDPNAYNDAKTGFIQAIEERSRFWKQQSGWQCPPSDWLPQD
jgi:GrpB-like predicted nucleotidyltransferase (UPF0157 family)